MVTVPLKGVHAVRTRLSSGTARVYFYAWRGGPRLVGSPGEAEFLDSYNRAHMGRKTLPKGTLATLIAAYRASPAFTNLAKSTLRAYRRYLDAIQAEFGDLPLAAVEDVSVRRDFIHWRDSMAATPRTADYAVAVLKALLAWAVEGVEIRENHAAPIKKLHRVDKSEDIWTAADIAAFEGVAPRELRWALRLALHTGLRQSDLIRLPWSALEGNAFSFRTSKTRKRVLIPATPACHELLRGIDRRGLVILTTAKTRRPWTADGLRASFNAVREAAGVKRTFHDLRRTAATNLLAAGVPDNQVAMIMGWSTLAIEDLKRLYVSRSAVVASMLAQMEKGG